MRSSTNGFLAASRFLRKDFSLGNGSNGLQVCPAEKRPETAINRPGLAHLAFEVDDVEAARDAVIAAGGGCVGDLVAAEIPGAGTVKMVYLTDPEGNIIELQKWD